MANKLLCNKNGPSLVCVSGVGVINDSLTTVFLLVSFGPLEILKIVPKDREFEGKQIL